jgi:hypothetical protein
MSPDRQHSLQPLGSAPRGVDAENGTQVWAEVVWHAVCHVCDWEKRALSSQVRAETLARTHWTVTHGN